MKTPWLRTALAAEDAGGKVSGISIETAGFPRHSSSSSRPALPARALSALKYPTTVATL